MIIGIVTVITGYLLGSIPTPLIMSRLRKGIDIRSIDSGNMGAASVIRNIGIWEGIVVGIVDIAKGALAVIIPRLLGLDDIWSMAAGIGALLGHKYPLFASFKGGKGSATIIGIFLILSPPAIATSLIIIAIPIFINRNFAIAISIGFALLPLFIFLYGYPLATILYAAIIDIYMLLTNISQIQQTLKTIIRKNK